MKDSTRPAPVAYWLTAAFFPPLVGGQELIAAHLAQGLYGRGFQVQVITRQTIPPSPARENVHGVEVRHQHPKKKHKKKNNTTQIPVAVFLLKLVWILFKDTF